VTGEPSMSHDAPLWYTGDDMDMRKAGDHGSTRREFLELAAAALAGGCRGVGAPPAARVPYGPAIGDRLWMWGHHRDAFKGLKGSKENYNLPYETRIDMADACRAMGIPGCFVVRWTNKPTAAELPEYMEQFRDTRRVGFSITDSAVEPFEEKVRLGFEYADRMPNLTTFVMDDFWSGAAKGVTPEMIRRVKDGLVARGMRLAVVLYSDANGLKPEYREVLDLCDEVTFWFWHGRNTGGIEASVDRLRGLVGPSKPILLGQYMWDFGGRKPMPGDVMARQLEQTGRLLVDGRVAGVIFHCTPLVDMDLDAVKVSKDWIRAHAAVRV